LADEAEKLIAQITENRWWQGSVIPDKSLSGFVEQKSNIDYWVVASQTCNLYNPDFKKIPVFELIAGRKIDKCLPQFSKGDNPRIIHVEAFSDNGKISVEIDIQKRNWLPRHLLAELEKPIFNVQDSKCGDDPYLKYQWLDNFIGWLARSYNRITLPDKFNEAMRLSRIEEVLQKKLTKHHENCMAFI